MDETPGMMGTKGVFVRGLAAAARTLALVLLLMASASLPAQGADEKVVLNADRVSFNDATGQARAEGKASLSYQGTTIQAERIDYDAETQKVQAMPLPGEQVVMSREGRSLLGDHLDYDLVNQEGVMTGAATKMPLQDGTLYVYGGEINVMPWDMAVERGVVKGRVGGSEDYVAQWRQVSLTTCALDHPHYHLESKSISFIPGKSIVAKKPRIYLGKTYIMTSPLDYVVQLKRRAVRYSVLPYVQHSDSRGTGGGLTGTLAWETGSFSLGFAWAGRSGAEWRFSVEQDLGHDFSFLAQMEYSWDDVWSEAIWRPSAALIYERDGWRARLNWRRDEYVEDQKDSLHEYKGRLDREPELVVQTPWFRTSPWAWLTLSASFGSYREKILTQEGDFTSRWGLEAHSYFERPLSPQVELFADLKGAAWFYDRDDADQQMFSGFLGLRYRLGVFEMGSAYERRYTWGKSAMLWDQYRGAERVHQKVRFPLGREVYAAFRGSYDLEEAMMDEAIYSLQWSTDCMLWDLHFMDDRTSGNDDKVGLSLSILAFPDRDASLGQSLTQDPFLRPRDIPKEGKR